LRRTGAAGEKEESQPDCIRDSRNGRVQEAHNEKKIRGKVNWERKEPRQCGRFTSGLNGQRGHAGSPEKTQRNSALRRQKKKVKEGNGEKGDKVIGGKASNRKETFLHGKRKVSKESTE